MKTGPDALGTSENELRSAKHEKGTRCPRYRRKRVRERKTRKWDPTPPILSKMSPGAQNMKTGHDALGTVEKEFGRAKHENQTRGTRYHRKRVKERKTWKQDPTHSVPPKMSPGEQNMKTGPDFLGTSEDEPWRAKNENETKRPWDRRNRDREGKTRKRDPTPSEPSKTCPWAENMKSGLDAFGTVENESGIAKHENETRRPRYSRERVLERKIRKRDLTSSVPPKMSLEAQNMKTGPDALGTAENETGSAKHENETRRPRYRRKRVY
jgi:hypothetical protein